MERIHIVLLGACNSGKSSVANMLAGQNMAMVSAQAGTTTDAVRKVMEIHHLGACMIVDTPGFDDTTTLGKERIAVTQRALNEANIVLLLTGENPEEENLWRLEIERRKIPFIEIANKADLGRKPIGSAIPISAVQDPDNGRKRVVEAILSKLPVDFGESNLLRGLARRGDIVVLVMPQDIAAPKGRLILPQVQTLRALLDLGAIAISVTPEELTNALSQLSTPPRLIITDSQVFDRVAPLVPNGTMLTSFSVLMAAHKGDIDFFAKSASAIDALTPESRVLIAEACTHPPVGEDIGTVKIPALLRKKIGEGLTIDHVAGRDFPEDPTGYDLIIHCGGCMFNRPFMLQRIELCREKKVPITNYGVTLAHLTGILSRVAW